MEAGMASASGREFRKTNFPIWVIPWAVVDVPMMGTPLALASGPTTFISLVGVDELLRRGQRLLLFPGGVLDDQVDPQTCPGVHFLLCELEPVGDRLPVRRARARQDRDHPDLRMDLGPFPLLRIPGRPQQNRREYECEDQSGQPDLPVHGEPLEMVCFGARGIRNRTPMAWIPSGVFVGWEEDIRGGNQKATARNIQGKPSHKTREPDSPGSLPWLKDPSR